MPNNVHSRSRNSEFPLMLPRTFLRRYLRRWVMFAVLVAVAMPGLARTVTDMLGRTVTVPDRIERVFGSAPPLNVLLHAVAPEAMVGVSFPIPEPAGRYFPPSVRKLPVVGGIFGMGQQMNAETVLALRPDVALAWQSPFIDRERIESAFAKMGVPVVFIRLDDLDDWPAALRFAGRLLGREAAAENKAADIEQVLQRLRAAVAAVPSEGRPRVYYAEGADGLATDCHRSFHTEAIELAGGYNVYRCTPKDHMGMERISLEQVLAFNPEVILVQEPAAMAAIGADPRWAAISAVQSGRIPFVPRWPHNWRNCKFCGRYRLKNSRSLPTAWAA